MVQRNSQDAQFSSPGDVQAQGSNAGYANPDPNKFATNTSVASNISPDGSGERLLNLVVGIAGKLGEQKLSQSKEEAFLSGQAQAGVIKSEDELQANPITRNWATAGYRDTVGRLAAADMQAQIAQDMHKMREKSPEEFSEYLAEKRNKVLDSFSGMTLDTRKTLFAQQLVNDRSAIQKHGQEHYQFVTDQENKSVNAALFTSTNALNLAKTDPESYKAATMATYTTALSSIVYNPKLTPEIKAKFVGQFAEQALADDNQALFLKMQQDTATLADGTSSPMLSMASAPDQLKLSGMYRDSLKRTEASRGAVFMDGLAQMRAGWTNPNTPMQSNEEVNAYLKDGISKNFVSADQYETYKREYYSAYEKKAGQLSLAGAYQSGDTGKIISLGKTQDEALQAFKSTAMKTMGTQGAVSALMNIGMNTGQESAFKAAGEIMAPAFVQLGNRKDIDPGQAATLAGVLQSLDQAKAAGHEGAYSQFISVLSPEAQSKVTYFRDALKAGNDPVTAITKATSQVMQESQLTPAQRAELSASKAKDIQSVVDEITPRGMFDTAILGIKTLSPFGTTSANASSELALRPFEGWFENATRKEEVMATGKIELLKKMSQLSQSNPSMSATSLKEQALSDIKSRTVGTTWGPLVVPDGMSPQRFFGVAQSVPNDRIASAMEEYIKAGPDNRMAFSLGVNGELVARELNKRGEVVNSQTMDPKVLAPLVDKQQKRLEDTIKANEGEGVVRKVGDVTLNYNGQNTANVEPAWVLRYRDSLVKHEGVKNIPYTDASGKTVDGKPVQTVGVGVSSHNPNYPAVGPDGKVADAAINASFIAASNSAAQAGQRAMMLTGTVNEASFQLFAQLAYQSGEKFSGIPVYNTMLKGIGTHDYEAAHAALLKSPAYSMSDPVRRKYYEDKLKAAMKG